MPDELITHQVDTTDFVEVKARSLACHATQMNPNSPLMKLPPDALRRFRSLEVFHQAAGVPAPEGASDDLFAGLE
jgi:LmbE family N-acetylglucosaminyl deacetylase